MERRYDIKNVVLSGNFVIRPDKIELSNLKHPSLTFEYDSKKFPAIIIRTDNPKFTSLVFGTGAFVITGLQSIESIEASISTLRKILEESYIEDDSGKVFIKIDDVTYQFKNIVAVSNVSKHKNINLESALLMLDNAIYEPEIFPALILYLSGKSYGRAVCLLFKNGNAVCVGVNDVNAIEDAFNDVRKLISMHNLDLPMVNVSVPEISINELIKID